MARRCMMTATRVLAPLIAQPSLSGAPAPVCPVTDGGDATAGGEATAGSVVSGIALDRMRTGAVTFPEIHAIFYVLWSGGRETFGQNSYAASRGAARAHTLSLPDAL